MPFKLDSKLPLFAALGLACMAAGSLQADIRPPAGQMCPEGAYVRGFDANGNIVCAAGAGAVSSNAPETTLVPADEGGQACPEGCVAVTDAPVADAGSGAPATHPAEGQATAADNGGPAIAKIKPFGVVFGARETTIKIIGSGFTAGTIVRFQGATYTPTVNAEGTELRVTIETRDLPIGRYAITVSNSDGTETTKRGALEVF